MLIPESLVLDERRNESPVVIKRDPVHESTEKRRGRRKDKERKEEKKEAGGREINKEKEGTRDAGERSEKRQEASEIPTLLV